VKPFRQPPCFVLIVAEARTQFLVCPATVATIQGSATVATLPPDDCALSIDHPLPFEPAFPAYSRWVTGVTVPSNRVAEAVGEARSRSDPFTSISHEVSRAPLACKAVASLFIVFARVGATGAPAKAIQELARHADLSTTMPTCPCRRRRSPRRSVARAARVRSGATAGNEGGEK